MALADQLSEAIAAAERFPNLAVGGSPLSLCLWLRGCGWVALHGAALGWGLGGLERLCCAWNSPA